MGDRGFPDADLSAGQGVSPSLLDDNDGGRTEGEVVCLKNDPEGVAPGTEPGVTPAEPGGGGGGGDAQPGLLRRALGMVLKHPLVTVAIVVGVVAAANAWWIWTHRYLGGFDPDESSYLSTALRIQRSIDPRSPVDFVRAVLSSGHGVAVPTFSLPFLLVGPRDPRTAMMLQPVLQVFIGVAVAGITRRLARPSVAIVAGCWVALLPTLTPAVQSYWYGLGAAAALVGAVWALLESDRGRNRIIWLFALAVGLMLLSRTMTLGYLPACGVAVLVVCWGDRRGLFRGIGALVLGVVIASPWYLLNRNAIFGYLLSFGYGERAELFGQAGFGNRVSLRWERYVNGLSPIWFPGELIVPIAVAVGALCAVTVYRCLRRRPPAGMEPRAYLAIGAAVVVGTAALISTANNGVWFELPLVVLVVPLVVGAVAQLPRPVWLVAATAALAVGAVNLVGALWFTSWDVDRPVSHYEWGFSEYDERFAPSTRAEHEAAAGDWWALSQEIEQAMRSISPDARTAAFVVTGNTHLVNAGTIRMAAELDSWDPTIIIPDTTSASTRSRELSPTVTTDRPAERVLVVGLHDQILWPLDADVLTYLDEAEQQGYRVVDRFRMPRGGEFVILRRPDASATGSAGG
jgi:hypothetical protein